MAKNTQFTLSYCEENKKQAQIISDILSMSGVSFQHLPCSNNTHNYSQSLEQAEKPIILLFSDNFLKSPSCLYDSAGLIQRLSRTGELLPVIIDGVKKDADNQEKLVKTNFDRVSHMIYYMNYWQDKYLEIRRQKRQLPPEEDDNKGESELDVQLKTIQSISSSIGDLIKFFKNVEHYSYTDFSENNFKIFFNKFNLDDLYQQFKTLTLPKMPQYKEEDESEPENTSTSLPEQASPDEETYHRPEQQAQKESEQEQNENIEVDTHEKSVMEEIYLTDEDTEGEDGVPESIHYHSDTKASVDENDTSELESILFGEEESEDEAEETTALDEEIENEIWKQIPGLDQIPEFSEDNQIQDGGTDSPAAGLESNEDIESEGPPPAAGIQPEPDKDDEFLEYDAGKYGYSDADQAQKEGEQESEQPVEESYGSQYKADLDEDFMETDLFEDELEEEEADNVEEQILTNELADEIDDFEHIIKSANFLLQTGEITQGINLLETIIKSKPESKKYRNIYACALYDYQVDVQKAIHELSAILEEHENYLPSLLKLSEIREQTGDFIEALKLLEKASDINPSLKDIDYKIALLLQSHMSDDKKRAAKALHRALKKDKNNVDATYRYALLLLELKPEKWEKAEKLFKRCLKLSPDHPFAAYDLALLYYQQEEWKKAAKYYLKASHINPELRTNENDEAFNISTDGEWLGLLSKQESSDPTLFDPSSAPTILITGATSGIGKAIAEKFAREGYRLILTGRRLDRLEAIQESLQSKFDVPIFTLNFDVRDQEACKKSIENIPEEWQQIDILVNNAGLAKGLSSIHEGDLIHWDTMIDTNIKGLLQMTRLIAPGMVARRHGHIINISSIAGQEVYPNGNVYCATKHAVDALTRSMQLDLHKYNIRVSQVSPGHVEETEFALVRFDGDQDKSNIYQDFRPLHSSDVAEAVYFIASMPSHVMIRDITLTGTQQASANLIDRSGR